jgi:BolA-like protein 1
MGRIRYDDHIMANEAIIEKLRESLEASHVEIIDNSWMHAGHVAMADVNRTEGTHLQVIVVSPQFEGVGLLNRHRMVHEVLKEAFSQGLHALELKTMTPDEWQIKVSG